MYLRSGSLLTSGQLGEFATQTHHLPGLRSEGGRRQLPRNTGGDHASQLPPGDIRQCLRKSGLSHRGGAAGIEWVEARGDAKRPLMHRVTPPPNHLAPRVHSAGAGNPALLCDLTSDCRAWFCPSCSPAAEPGYVWSSLSDFTFSLTPFCPPICEPSCHHTPPELGPRLGITNE